MDPSDGGVYPDGDQAPSMYISRRDEAPQQAAQFDKRDRILCQPWSASTTEKTAVVARRDDRYTQSVTVTRQPSPRSTREELTEQGPSSASQRASRKGRIIMGVCFAFLCNDASLTKTAQVPFRSALTLADGAPAGWGVAHYNAGQALLLKQPRALPEGPIDICNRIEHLRSTAIIGHVRAAADGDLVNENLQPFRFRRWIFTHCGTLSCFNDIRSDIERAIPDFMRRNIQGSTDSEVLFHLFLAFLNDAGVLEEETISGSTAGKALSAALDYVDHLVAARDGKPSTTCCMATNGHVLIASPRQIPLFVSRKSQYLSVDGLPGDKPKSYPHLKAVVLLGGREAPGDGWELVSEGSVLTVDHELNIGYLPLQS